MFPNLIDFTNGKLLGLSGIIVRKWREASKS